MEYGALDNDCAGSKWIVARERSRETLPPTYTKWLIQMGRCPLRSLGSATGLQGQIEDLQQFQAPRASLLEGASLGRISRFGDRLGMTFGWNAPNQSGSPESALPGSDYSWIFLIWESSPGRIQRSPADRPLLGDGQDLFRVGEFRVEEKPSDFSNLPPSSRT